MFEDISEMGIELIDKMHAAGIPHIIMLIDDFDNRQGVILERLALAGVQDHVFVRDGSNCLDLTPIKAEEMLFDQSYLHNIQPTFEVMPERITGGAIWREQSHLHEDPAHGRQNIRRHKKHNKR